MSFPFKGCYIFNASKQDSEHVATQTGSSPRPSWDRNKRHSISIPYLSGVSGQFRRILQKHDIPVQFKPSNTLRQRLVHHKDKTPRHKQSNVVYAVQRQEDCNEMGKLTSPSINKWPDTDVPLPQDKIKQDTYT